MVSTQRFCVEEGDVIDFLERRRVVAAKIFIVKMRPVCKKHLAKPGSISHNPFHLFECLATFYVLPLFCLLNLWWALWVHDNHLPLPDMLTLRVHRVNQTDLARWQKNRGILTGMRWKGANLIWFNHSMKLNLSQSLQDVTVAFIYIMGVLKSWGSNLDQDFQHLFPSLSLKTFSKAP